MSNNPANFVGTLIVHIHKCTRLPDVENFGKQDPYIRIRLDTDEPKKAQKGKVQESAGVNPTFEETFSFILQGFERSVVIHIMDSEVVSDREIAQAEIGIEELVKKTESQAIWFGLKTKKGQSGGEIFIKATFSGQTPAGRWPPENKEAKAQPAPPQAAPPQAVPQQPMYPQPPQQPMYAQPPQQPMYAQPPQQPMYAPVQQPMYAQPPQQPMYGQPQPAFGQQPMYAQPLQQQPMYGQPAFGQQPIYGQQPPAPQQVYQQPPAQQPMYGQQPFGQKPR